MQTDHLKKEIQKALDHVPEYILQDIFNYLKEVESTSHENLSFSNNVKKILTEDRELLKRLAE